MFLAATAVPCFDGPTADGSDRSTHEAVRDACLAVYAAAPRQPRLRCIPAFKRVELLAAHWTLIVLNIVPGPQFLRQLRFKYAA